MPGRRFLAVALGATLLAGCAAADSDTLKDILGVPAPAAARPAAETRWVLVQNPRFGATMAEPEYVWVEEDRIPGGLTTLIFGRQAVLAPQDAVRRYGPPPGGGQMSPLQGGPPLASRSDTAVVAPAGPRGLLRSEPAPAERATSPTSPGRAAAARGAPTPDPSPRGYVIHVQAGLVVVDLTAADGLKPGSRLSLRRERVPLVHPVTKERLGALDDEVGTARVIEVRERFSVAEIEETRPGFEPRVQDRAALKP